MVASNLCSQIEDVRDRFNDLAHSVAGVDFFSQAEQPEFFKPLDVSTHCARIAAQCLGQRCYRESIFTGGLAETDAFRRDYFKKVQRRLKCDCFLGPYAFTPGQFPRAL